MTSENEKKPLVDMNKMMVLCIRIIYVQSELKIRRETHTELALLNLDRSISYGSSDGLRVLVRRMTLPPPEL